MSAAPEGPKLALEGVVKEFGDHRVLDGIDLHVGTGRGRSP